MAHFHRLDPTADREFLARGETDPFTGVPFRPTNVVVRAADGTVLLRETWEALDGSYAGSSETQPWDSARGDGASAPPPPAPRPTPPPVAPRAAAPPAPLPPPPTGYIPPPTPEPEPRRRRWWVPLLSVLGIALLAIVALLVFSQLNRQPEAPPVVVEEEPAAPQPVALQVGVIEGELGDGDRIENGRFEDRFTFQADSSGQVLAFVLRSVDFRPDLVVVGPDGQRYEGRPAGDEGNRVVVDDVRGPGRYQIRLTSREPAGEGEYSFRVRQETPIRSLAKNNQIVRATLGPESQRVEGFFRDTYEFSVEAEREYTLAVASTAFEVATTLTAGNGARVRTQEQGGALTFTPTSDGRYRLVVSSREAGKTGAYTVRLKEGPLPVVEPPPPPRALRPNAAPASDSLAAGESRTFTFEGRIGDRVRVDARALGFRPSLVLVGPENRRIPGQTTDDRANVQETLPTAGTYRVIVSGGEGSGLFQISLERTEAPRADDIPRMPGVDRPPTPPPADSGGEPEEYEPAPIDGGGGR